MKRIRFQVILLGCWLVLFCNLERFLGPLHLSEAVYPLALGMGFIMLFVPQAVQLPFWVTLATPVPVLILINALTGDFVGSSSIPQLISDAASIGLTAYLVRSVAQTVGEFECSVARITAGRQDHLPESLAQGQGLIYREVRRARNHQRPLTMVAVGVEDKSVQVALDRMIQEAQLEMMKHYTLSTVSKVLCSTLEDSDIIVQSKDHFLIVLPETRPEHVPGLIERLRHQVTEEAGVEVKIGTASFPGDGYTLEGLIDKATRCMQADLEPGMLFEIEPISVRQNIP